MGAAPAASTANARKIQSPEASNAGSRPSAPPRHLYTLTKVAWVAETNLRTPKKIAAVCLPHDWLSWRIAGYGRRRG